MQFTINKTLNTLIGKCTIISVNKEKISVNYNDMIVWFLIEDFKEIIDE
jgi:hypothetical protein